MCEPRYGSKRNWIENFLSASDGAIDGEEQKEFHNGFANNTNLSLPADSKEI